MVRDSSQSSGRKAGGSKDSDQKLEQLGRRLTDTVSRRRWWFIVTTAIVFAMAIVYVRHQRPVYRATGLLQIDTTPPKVLGEVNEVYTLGTTSVGGQRQYFRTQLAILQSRDLAAMVASRMGLGRDERFFGFQNEKKPLTKAQKESIMANADVVGMMASRVMVDMTDDTLVSRISVEDGDPEFARDLANTIMSAYKDRNINNKRRVVQDAYSDLRVLRKKMEDTKNESQQALFEFEHAHDFSETRRLSVNERILSLNAHLRDVHALRVKADLDVAQLKKARSGRDIFTMSAPAIMRDGLMGELKRRWLDLNYKRKELASTYLEKHPKLESVEEQIRNLEQLALRHVTAVYESAAQSLTSAEFEEKEIREQLLVAKAEDDEIRQAKLNHDRLQARADEDKMFYERVAKRYAETDLTKDVGVNNVSILDAAVTPRAPIRPNFQLGFAIGFLLALLAGVSAAMAADALDNTVQGREDVENLLGVPYLGAIPTFEPEAVTEGKTVPDGLLDLYVYYRPNSRAAEAARSIRTNLMFMRPDQPLHTLLVTSAHPREGKTSMSATLAITLAAASGKCVIVDTDLRKPRLHHVFGLPNIGGVTGYMMNKDTAIHTCVQATNVPGLDLLACGALPPNPSEVLHLDRFRQMIEDLKSIYDIVVLDSPPIEIVTDALVIASLVDAVVLVAHTGKSRQDWVLAAISQLRAINAPLMGVVLSRTVKGGVGYGYYYGKGYRKGGGYRARYQYRYRYGQGEEQDKLEAAHFAQPGGARHEDVPLAGLNGNDPPTPPPT